MAKAKKKEKKEDRIINLARELPTPSSSLKTSEQEPSEKKEDNK